MRTTLDLDDALVLALLSQHPDLSKTDAIETAIRAYLRDTAIERLRSRAGSFDIEDVSTELRRSDRHT
jgi:hypothetical protein